MAHLTEFAGSESLAARAALEAAIAIRGDADDDAVRSGLEPEDLFERREAPSPAVRVP